MTDLDKTERLVNKLREFSQSLQPVQNIPDHLYEVRGFVDYRPQENAVEISFFFRPRFLIITFTDDFPRHRAKLRMDFGFTVDEFESADPQELKAYMLKLVYSVSQFNIANMKGVEKVEHIFNPKFSLAGATQPVDWIENGS